MQVLSRITVRGRRHLPARRTASFRRSARVEESVRCGDVRRRVGFDHVGVMGGADGWPAVVHGRADADESAGIPPSRSGRCRADARVLSKLSHLTDFLPEGLGSPIRFSESTPSLILSGREACGSDQRRRSRLARSGPFGVDGPRVEPANFRDGSPNDASGARPDRPIQGGRALLNALSAPWRHVRIATQSWPAVEKAIGPFRGPNVRTSFGGPELDVSSAARPPLVSLRPTSTCDSASPATIWTVPHLDFGYRTRFGCLSPSAGPGATRSSVDGCRLPTPARTVSASAPTPVFFLGSVPRATACRGCPPGGGSSRNALHSPEVLTAAAGSGQDGWATTIIR